MRFFLSLFSPRRGSSQESTASVKGWRRGRAKPQLYPLRNTRLDTQRLYHLRRGRLSAEHLRVSLELWQTSSPKFLTALNLSQTRALICRTLRAASLAVLPTPQTTSVSRSKLKSVNPPQCFYANQRKPVGSSPAKKKLNNPTDCLFKIEFLKMNLTQPNVAPKSPLGKKKVVCFKKKNRLKVVYLQIEVHHCPFNAFKKFLQLWSANSNLS